MDSLFNCFLSTTSLLIVLGINQGKCIQDRSSYHGEKCLDNFRLPDDHLSGLSLYNNVDIEPVSIVYNAGAGVSNMDYILYVTSSYTTKCVNTPTIAYASYCKLDVVNQNRFVPCKAHMRITHTHTHFALACPNFIGISLLL